MPRSPLRAMIDAADAVRDARRQRATGERLNPVAEMLECIRLAHRWRHEHSDRAAVVAALADAWARDAIDR